MRGKIARALCQIRDTANLINACEVAQDAHLSLMNLQDDSFRIVVAGEFSRGKSTLVNALLGDLVLPASSQPTTAMLNRIHAADEPTFILHYRDKRPSETLAKEAFRLFVAPPEPIPGDENSEEQHRCALDKFKEIAHAEIGYPAALCQNGVEIIDTPGTNDLDPVREQITYDIIPSSDAIIIVLSARMILAKTEMDFLKDRILKADIRRIFFVINFADHLQTPEDCEKVLSYAWEHLRPVVGEPRIYLVCAKAALNHRRQKASTVEMPFSATGILDLERDLAMFLLEERMSAKLEKPVAHGLRLCHEITDGPLAIAQAAVGLQIDEIRKRIAALTPELRRIEGERDRVITSLRAVLMNRGQEIASELRCGLEEVARTAVVAVDTYTGPLTKEDLAHAIERVVAPCQTELQERIRERQRDILIEECGRAQRDIDRAWEHLHISIDSVFTCAPARVEINQPEIPNEDELVVKAGVGAAGIGFLVTALHIAFPVAIAAAIFGGRWMFTLFGLQARDRALGRVRAQVDSRYRDIIPATMKEFEQRWDSTTGGLLQSIGEEFNRTLDGIRRQFSQLQEAAQQASVQADTRRNELSCMASSIEEARNLLEKVKQGGDYELY